jgi:hypothetical protein
MSSTGNTAICLNVLWTLVLHKTNITADNTIFEIEQLFNILRSCFLVLVPVSIGLSVKMANL